MREISDLLMRLRDSGVPMNESIADAMQSVDIEEFTDFDITPFLMDRPIPFLSVNSGTTKTISAPHMIATLLHHLEVLEGHHVLVLGSKGGYLAALLDSMLGPAGAVTVVEPHPEVRRYTSDRLDIFESMGEMRVVPIECLETLVEDARPIDRVLVTGAIRELSTDFENLVGQGGFVLGPFGGPVHQRLLKRERQGDEWLDTDLGGVVFGPMDLEEAERSPLEPQNLAEHLEDILGLISEIIEIEDETVRRIEGLISSLRELPRDIPDLDEGSTEDEIMEHPVIELLLMEMDWLGPMWPIFGDFLSVEIASPGSPDDEEYGMSGGHEDLVP
ncbi:MAG: protein-L-isoaspartate O-methyltransferase family protein [Candidatus Thalassarchaeum sp.]